MEEDVEIELLYKTHGEALMEAAATEHMDDGEEGEASEVCKGEQVRAVERPANGAVPGKKRSRRKKRRKILATGKTSTKRRVGYDDSSTDLEELLDARILSCVVAGGPKSAPESMDEITTYLGNDESNCCVSEVLHGSFRKRSLESEDMQINNDGSKNSEDMCVLELISLQSMIDQREDLLEQIEIKLEGKLLKNEGEIKDEREAINYILRNETIGRREPNLTKSFYKKFGMPYFQDRFGFPAPPNNDSKERLKNGELICTLMPKLRYWRKSHKDKLQDGIQLTLINEKTDRLVTEINKLKDALKNVPDEQTEKEILKKIVEHQIQLKKIKSMSYLDLLANENHDREYDWLKYSAVDLNGVHSSEECQRFWHLYLKPTVNKSRWERSEDEKLKKLAEERKFQDWDSIANALGTNRTGYQCVIHYRNRLNDKPEYSVGKWTKEEDEKLLNVINAVKVGDYIPWTKVATYMGDRNHNQVYNRYSNCLNPKLVKGRFSNEEDLLIVSGVEVFGATYKEIASLMSNRTPNQIRDRYERHLSPKTAKTGTFSLEEDEQLLKLVKKHKRNYALVADEMKTRTRTQVRQRYNFMEQMMKKKPGWTPAQVKRRSIHIVSKNAENTKNKVEKLRKEVEEVEETFQLTKLESDTFRIEKLKELRDDIFMKKYDFGKIKKKTYVVNTDISSALRQYFTVPNNSVQSSIRRNRRDNVAILNELMMLSKYFGHDIELPTFANEIKNNNRLSHPLKTFLIETLNEKAFEADNDEADVEESASTSAGDREPYNIDYVEPEVDDTLVMEERWYNSPVNVSNFNFSEFFKRTVFDYSSGMHQQVWDSKINRSKIAKLKDDVNIAEPSNTQKYFIPPNSLTALGYKSILLCKPRLTKDANKLPENHVKPVYSPTFHALVENFQDTLLSLYYCPRVLSRTMLKDTSISYQNSIPLSSSQSLMNHEGIVDLLSNPNQTPLDIVRKVAKPIKNEALKEKKMKRAILEHNRNRHRQLKEFKVGITYKRKMDIEHLVKSVKKPKTNLKWENHECGDGVKVKSSIDGSNALKSSGFQNTNHSRRTNKFNKLVSSGELIPKVPPTHTYSRPRRSLQSHLDSEIPSEPAHKESVSTNMETTEPTASTCQAADILNL